MSQRQNVEAQPSTKWFSRSKSRAPKFSIPLVERKRLLSMLNSVLHESISCIVAPAGFGKSTLLSQWRESLLGRDIACAWINLDENDSEIHQFFAYLVFAFEDAGVSLGYLKKAAENGFVDMSSSAITTSLLSAIIDIEDHMVLILDDYHRAASSEIDKFVNILSDQCSDKVHIAIGSRKPVKINLPSLLVAGRAIEIPSVQLRFSDREVEEAMGGNPDKAAIAALQEQVEGWPVAVQMTRLLGGSNDRHVVSRTGIVSSHGYLADYLVTNVLESQSEDLQQFLLETAILKRFSAELANSVCDHQNSEQFIGRLQSLQALVVPLDDDSEWFRYHHLFSECLSDLLNRQDPDRFNELHRRAAKWCGENRMIAEAVNYANAIKDYDLSKKIINDNCEWLRAEQFGGVGYLNGLISNIPEEQILKDPRILFSKSYACMLAGNFKNALHYHHLAEARVEQAGLTPETFRDRLGIGTAILTRCEFQMKMTGGWLEDRLRIVQDMMVQDPAPDRKIYVLSCLVRAALAKNSLIHGNFDAARDHAAAAKAVLEQADTPVMAIYLKVDFGLIELWSNDLNKARRCFEEASEDATRFGGDRSNMKSMGETLVCATDYWQSGLKSDHACRLEKSVLQAIEGDGGYEVYSIGYDSIVHDALCRRDYEKANGLIDSLEQSTTRFGIRRLTQFAEVLRLEFAVANEDLVAAAPIFANVKGWLNLDQNVLEGLGWRHKATALYSCSRFLRAVGRYEDALETVDKGLVEPDSLDVVLMRVRGNILKASILESFGKRDKALQLLENTIVDAARVDCARAFAADISDALLTDAVSSTLEKTPTNMVKEFASRLSTVVAQKLFSTREDEVLQGIAQGKSNKEIARELDLTDNTIKFHLRNIYRKLGVKKRVPAVERARALGVL